MACQTRGRGHTFGVMAQLDTYFSYLEAAWVIKLYPLFLREP